MPTLTDHINRLLPQTQCRECGYAGCLPYAQALAEEHADIHLCKPGGEAVLHDLSRLLRRPVEHAAPPHQNVVAYIDEAVCIGCTACIRACPVDAIMGASKFMHTVLTDECTGCGLCVAPCPVDCIDLIDVKDEFLPRNHYLASQPSLAPRSQAAEHAKARYDNHTQRKQRENDARRAKLAQREAATKQQFANPEQKNTFNPADLIAQAMAKAQAQKNQRVVPNNHEDFQKIQIQKAQEKALYSRNMNKMRYGNDEEKAQALIWLREYKATQEAKLTKK